MSSLNSNQSSSATVKQEKLQFAALDPATDYRDPGEPTILTHPYQLVGRAAAFRAKYTASIGRTVHSAGFGSHRHGLNAVDIRESLDCLGFERIAESLAAVSVADTEATTDDGKVNWAVSIPRNNPEFYTASYLIMRPFVDAMDEMCSKWLLVASMRRLEARMRRIGRRSFVTASGQAFTHEEFTPFTVNLNNPNLMEILVQRPGIYLAKPTRGTMGQLQQLVTIRADSVQADLLRFLLASKFLEMNRSQVILQRYLDRPLLIDKRKFDMRVYYMVVSTKRQSADGGDPTQYGYFAFLHPGFVRLCTAPYDINDTDLAVHLTNQSIQAKHSHSFDELKEVTTWYPDELNSYLNRRRKSDIPLNWARDVLYPKVGAILGYISALYRPHMSDRDMPASTFRILGVDILVDADLRVHLLEFNEFPAWGRQTSVLKEIKPNVWREAACLVSEVVIRFRATQPVKEELLVTRQNFRLVYSSEDPGLARDRISQLYTD